MNRKHGIDPVFPLSAGVDIAAVSWLGAYEKKKERDVESNIIIYHLNTADMTCFIFHTLPSDGISHSESLQRESTSLRQVCKL